jgi:hypothetical protein
MTPQRSRRTAVILLIVAALAIVAVVIVPFFLLNLHYDKALAEMTGQLERYQRTSASRGVATQQLETIRALEPRKGFLRTGAAALSAAEAQEAMRSMIEANGGKLITMRAPVVRASSAGFQLTVNVQLSGKIYALRKILHAIETNQPALFVESLQVRSQVPANFKPNPGNEPDVYMQLDVSGFAVPGSG